MGGLSSNTQVSLNLIKGGLTCSIRDFPTLEDYIDEIDGFFYLLMTWVFFFESFL